MSTDDQYEPKGTLVSPRTGWICPKCNKALSPDVTECDCNGAVRQPDYVPIYPYCPKYPVYPWPQQDEPWKPYITWTSGNIKFDETNEVKL